MATSVILDREELYRDVWSKGADVVARKYVLTESDIMACFALGVPKRSRVLDETQSR